MRACVCVCVCVCVCACVSRSVRINLDGALLCSPLSRLPCVHMYGSEEMLTLNLTLSGSPAVALVLLLHAQRCLAFVSHWSKTVVLSQTSE